MPGLGLLYHTRCSHSHLAIGQPAPSPARGAAPNRRPSLTAPGSRASTRPTAPDRAQPISSRARPDPEAPPLARGMHAHLAVALLFESEGELPRDAVTPRQAFLLAEEKRRYLGCGLGSTAALEVSGPDETGQGKAVT